MKKAVVLVSGGLDSATVLGCATREGYACHALTVNYGQRHVVELACAAKVARHFTAVEHKVINIDLREFGASALTADIQVPHGRTMEEMNKGIPITYVPARNTVFLSLALAWSEAIGGFDIFAGMNAIDYSGYPDCRPQFIQSFEILANLATKAAVEGAGSFKIHTPLIQLSKKEIIQLGNQVGVDFSLTHSCYSPLEKGVSCGECDSCKLRLAGFEQAGLVDPVVYSRGAK